MDRHVAGKPSVHAIAENVYDEARYYWGNRRFRHKLIEQNSLIATPEVMTDKDDRGY